MRPEIYFNIHDWMIHKLNLSGNKLLTLALLYAYQKKYKSGLRRLEIAKKLGICPTGIQRLCKKLEEQGLVHLKYVKEPVPKFGVPNNYYVYMANLESIHKKAFN